jgi:lipopolysaccharide transport system ATP-binding protein
MSNFAIEAEGLSKRYFLGEESTSLRIKQAAHAIAPRLFNSRLEELWAVKDASFTIRKGEAVGIIGGNGAGKSTLLKLLTRITPPTCGSARIHGRVGTMLEVGTGFHPELTGRDNIALSGSILGMRPSEVAQKFDEIVAFSEIGQFLETPVKRYSSGMYCRLAFAVAAFLDPDILVVDEVLAVGDAGFQRKSLGRLNDASEREGRTVLFVSHNFQAIRAFCRRVIVLDHGRIIFDGPTDKGLEMYIRSIPRVLDVRDVAAKNRKNRTSGAVRFTQIVSQDTAGQPRWQFQSGETIVMRFGYEVMAPVADLMFILRFTSAATGETVSTIRNIVSESSLAAQRKGIIELTLPDISLRPNELAFQAYLARGDAVSFYDVVDSNVGLPFLQIASEKSSPYDREGIISLDYKLDFLADSELTTF